MSETVVARRATIRIHRTSEVTWSAIIGGWLLATGIAWLLYVLGLAVGFSLADPTGADGTPRGWGIGTRLWLLLTWGASLFLGGMFASWIDGKDDRTVGLLQGVAVWALSTTVTALLAGVGAAHVVQGGATLVGSASGVLAAGVNGAQRPGTSGITDANQLQAALKQRITQALAKPAGGGADVSGLDTRRVGESTDPQTTAAVGTDLIRGNVEAARARLMADTGLSQAEADQVIQSLSAQTERVKQELKEAADRAAKYLAAVMWSVFFCSALGLMMAMLGGWVGAGHLQNVYDTDIA